MRADFLIVGLGGFVGSMVRYAVYVWFSSKQLTSFPWATLSINVLGCLLIGILSSALERSVPNSRQLFLLGSVGFLGAFTTFSAFGLETLNLMRGQQMTLALANVAANVVLGVFAVWAGRALSSGLFS